MVATAFLVQDCRITYRHLHLPYDLSFSTFAVWLTVICLCRMTYPSLPLPYLTFPLPYHSPLATETSTHFGNDVSYRDKHTLGNDVSYQDKHTLGNDTAVSLTVVYLLIRHLPFDWDLRFEARMHLRHHTGCRSFFPKEPLLMGFFCRKWPIKIRHRLHFRHPLQGGHDP